MKKLGGKADLYDKSVFMWHNESNLEGLIIIHVDDFEYCGTSSWHKNVIDKLCQMFKISKKEQNGDEIFVDQQVYVDGCEEIAIDRKKQLDHPLLEKEKKQLRSVCGQLLWATSQTRPDGAFHSCQVATC